MRSKWDQLGIPNPGSPQAVERGCLCARMDNRNGRGFPYHGELSFWVTQGCPVHAPITDTAPL